MAIDMHFNISQYNKIEISESMFCSVLRKITNGSPHRFPA